MRYAPIIIPTLCRSEHFIRLIESLKRNGWAQYTDIYVGIDFPPEENYRKGWQEICEYVDKKDFSVFSSFNVIKWKENFGTGRNISSLRQSVIKKYDRFIVIEDDNEVSPNFIEYMDKCLEAFENDSDVIAVSGYSYPIKWDVSEEATCVKQNFNASMWGIGFWKSKRSTCGEYIWSGQMLKDIDQVIKENRHKRMIDASLREYIPAAVLPIKKFNRMLYSMSDIGVRAYLAVKNKYVVSPVISKVRNHGFDGSGVYCPTIDDNLNGNTAGTYNYTKQPIDESDTFELVLNTKDSLDENRDRLNMFDSRTSSQMRQTRLYLWLMTHIGVWAGKICAVLFFPYDIAIRVYKKYVK